MSDRLMTPTSRPLRSTHIIRDFWCLDMSSSALRRSSSGRQATTSRVKTSLTAVVAARASASTRIARSRSVIVPRIFSSLDGARPRRDHQLATGFNVIPSAAAATGHESAANRVPLVGPEEAACAPPRRISRTLPMPPGSASQNLAKADRTLQKVGGGPVTTASIGRTRVGRAGPVEDWEKNCSFPLATPWREGNCGGRSAKLTDRAWRTPHRAFTH
jgi:hypothetical protein